MKIRGKERGFELNVQSHHEIEELCPGQDFSNFGQIFANKPQGEVLQLDMKIACILNKGFEDHKAFDDPSHTPEYLTMEDMRFLKVTDVLKLEAELLKAISEDEHTEIQTEEPKPEPGTGKKSPE